MNNQLNVWIVELKPIRVASAHGFGPSPEGIASEKLLSWAKKKGFMESPGMPLFFGFDNPVPSPGSPNYGYDLWMKVDAGVKAEGDVEIKDFPGGLYAVTRFKGLDNIGPTWKKLVAWRETSQYKPAHHQWLEELLVPAGTPLEEYIFNLYLPIAE